MRSVARRARSAAPSMLTPCLLAGSVMTSGSWASSSVGTYSGGGPPWVHGVSSRLGNCGAGWKSSLSVVYVTWSPTAGVVPGGGGQGAAHAAA